MIEQIDKEIKKVINQFGNKNTALNVYYHLRLSLLIRNLYLFHEVNIPEIFNTMKEISLLLFNKVTTDFINNGSYSKDKNEIFKFPNKIYMRTYSNFHKKYCKNILDNIHYDENHSNLQNKFIYAVGEKMEWKYFNLPQPIKLWLIGKKEISEFPFHPTLAHNLNQKVIAAGEIFFLWDKSTTFPKSIIVNNISGHFKPESLKSYNLNNIIKDSLKLPDETSIISFANDGIYITGPIRNKLDI